MVELGIDHSKQTSTHICSSTRALPNLQILIFQSTTTVGGRYVAFGDYP